MKLNLLQKSKYIFYAIILLVSCSKGSSSNSSNGYGTNNTGGTNTGTGNAVTMTGMAFSSANISVKAGTTVTWTNSDYMTHTVTADDGSFASSDMNNGDKYSYTFNNVGTFKYHCKYHGGMIGTVVVTQ